MNDSDDKIEILLDSKDPDAVWTVKLLQSISTLDDSPEEWLARNHLSGNVLVPYFLKLVDVWLERKEAENVTQERLLLGIMLSGVQIGWDMAQEERRRDTPETTSPA